MAAPTPEQLAGVADSSTPRSGAPTPAELAGVSTTSSSSSKPKTKHKHHFWDTVKAIPGDVASDVYNDLVETPAALAELGKAEYGALKSTVQHPWVSREQGKEMWAHPFRPVEGTANTPAVTAIGKGYVTQLDEMRKHPLRHPGDTALTVLPVVGTAARVAGGAATAARVARAGGGVRAASGAGVRAVVKPTIGDRTLTQDGAVSRGHYSRATSARGVQKVADRVLQAAPAGTRREAWKQRRMAKWNERTLRVQSATARAAGTRLQALGSKLNPAELYALRLVAEEVPTGRRAAAQELRASQAKHPKEAARHQERIALTAAAREFIDESSGKPVLKPGTRAAKAYELLTKASGERGDVLKNLGLMDEAAQQAAKTKAARFAAGGKTVKGGAPLDIGRVKIGDRVNAPGGAGRVTFVDRKAGTVRVTSYDRGNRAWDERTLPVGDLDKPGPQVAGAEDVTVSEGAPFIGNPVERGKMTGRAKVSSGGTFGHRRKPGSLKTSTGGSVEHALERNDVTNVVAERHAETVSLADTARRVKLIKRAGKAEPGRKDDVWVWTDKTVSSERIPQEVRKYLDNPESMSGLSEERQQSIRDKIREATFERHNWKTDEEARAQFEKLAEEGKGVFVPRKLLGDAGKSQWSGGGKAVRAIDTVNNAQKAALVYAKFSYPGVQALSNTAMALIHQGFAAPANIVKAARLSKSVGADYAAVVDDLMGQGAAMQAAFHGEGAVAHVSQKLASVMSRGVDTPARRAAFLHEAGNAGFGSPEKLKALLENDANADQLVEVAQRAKEAIVDFGEMSPFERNVVRRAVFVYGWQKGSVKYASHFFRDHPVQAAALAQLGQRGEDIRDNTLGPVPSYLRGLLDVGGGKAVNPAGVNFFQTPAQIGDALTHPRSGSLQSFLAPAPSAAVAALTGQDDIGRPLSGNPLVAARQTFVDGTPAVRALRAALPDNSALASALLGPNPGSKTFPDSNDPMFQFFLGGLYPRRYDKGALNKNAARDKLNR